MTRSGSPNRQLQIAGLPQWVAVLFMVAMVFLVFVCFLLEMTLDQHLHFRNDIFRQSLDSDIHDPHKIHQAVNRQKKQNKNDAPHDGGSPKLGVLDSIFGGTPEKLKAQFEKQYPPTDRKRIKEYVSSLKKNVYSTQSDVPYDIHNCPSEPPKGYPFAWNVMKVIENWNPDDTHTHHDTIHQGLCIFDWEKDYETAERYRMAEVPFIIQNNPDLLQTSERWNRDESYLLNLIGSEQHRTEHSQNNHFMYWKLRGASPKGWKAPTENIKLSYPEWLAKAKSLEGKHNPIDEEHWYFRLNSEYKTRNAYVYQELPIFSASKPSFFMVDPRDQRGINCRFGMQGVIAETHYDSTRNFIVLLGGERRYILAHPRECPHMELYKQGHPSGRHSAVDWSNPDIKKYPNFAKAQVNEVILQAGDALYLPTYWFHYIVSLNLNYQCNARSGVTEEYRHHIRSCGFKS